MNRTLPTFNGGSLEFTLTVPLINKIICLFCFLILNTPNFLIRLDIILILINHQIPVEKIESSKRSKNQTVPGANYCILTFSSWDFLADEAS